MSSLTYDKTGNLIGDVSESISRIDWTVYGKIASITKSGNTMSYGYDAGGNRPGAGLVARLMSKARPVLMPYLFGNKSSNGKAAGLAVHRATLLNLRQCASGALSVYFDGQLLTQLATAGFPLSWGIVYNGSSDYTLPDVDVADFKHLRVYNRVITPPEIAANMQSACFMPEGDLAYSTNPLLLWYRFNIPAGGGAESNSEAPMPFLVPQHRMPTNYYYNSLNKVIKQSSPDGGTSEFWYDRLGRLAVSQNEEQKSPTVVDLGTPADRYSYTKYDELGRITEVGEKLDADHVTESNARNQAWLEAWLASGEDRDATLTYYDEEPGGWLPSSLTGTLSNLRKRVVATVLVYGSDPANYRRPATYYSYDISGNVKTLTQENTALKTREAAYVTGSTGLKEIKYEYDLVSGKVNKVLYQDGKWDQFYYQYLYDADNRVIKALSSRTNENDPNLWVTEATYHYYLHGPLARVELGKNKVQGMDYAYTLQGWLKGMNGQFLNPGRDMSMDGKAGEPFANHGRDALAFSLGYYDNDYTPIAGHNNAQAFNVQFISPTYDETGVVRSTDAGRPLYNGNISNGTYAIAGINAGATYGKSYTYDQLNRLLVSRLHTAISGSFPYWDYTTNDAAYAESFGYDANGNILRLYRNGAGTASPLFMDELLFNYNRDGAGNLINNRLNYVTDFIPGNYHMVDMDAQYSNNYKYDKIGNLISDDSQYIAGIEWTLYGKIAGVWNGYTGIDYGYDAAGYRITKTQSGYSSTKEDYYVRDAQGNVLGIYSYDNTNFTWAEQHLYGSSRLGMVTPGLTIQNSAPLANANYNATGDPITNGTEGKRIYELTNHLGNVMVTISDKKTGVDEDSDTVIDYYEAEVLTAQDYYAFGMLMPGRTYSNAGAKYKYGFNGKENDDEVKGEGNSLDFGDRIYDPRLGRWLSLDPLQKKYPWESHYSFVSNNPTLYIDADGKDKIIIHKYVDIKTGETYMVRQVVSNDVKSIPKRVANGNHWWQDSHDWHWEYDWHDINQEVIHVMSNGAPVKTTVGPETLGEVRLTTDYNIEWYAKTQIARYEGGIIFTSKKGGSEEVKTAILPVDIINIDALLETFDVASKAGTTKNFHDKLEAFAKAKGLQEKSAAIKELKTIIDNTIDVVKKSAEKVPSGIYSSEDDKKTKYKPNSTVCISCGNDPHGLTDGITDEHGKVVDTIKHTIRYKYNPKTKTKSNERTITNDTIPSKKD